jgi:hypothetical protein
MKDRLYACTGDSFARIERARNGWRLSEALAGSGAQCLAVDPTDPDRVLVGCRGAGLQRSDDGGASFTTVELPESDVFSVAWSGADGSAWAGTEPSRLFRSPDGADGFEELEALQEIPSREEWSFPPRPWTSHVRWIAPDPHRAELVLVGIELGGLMRTDDGGRSFSDHRAGAQRDVHCLAWHPATEGRAYQTGGGGAAWSEDGGETWSAADEGRDCSYCWGLAVDPADPDRWFLSAAPGPREAHGAGPAQARLYRWEGAGPWRRAGAGLPEPLDAMPYALAFLGDRLLVGLSDGWIFAGDRRGERFEPLDVRLDSLTAIAL